MREGLNDQKDRREQLDQIMRQHLPALLGFAVRMTGNPDQGEELVQDTMLRAVRNWEKFRGDSNPKTWLFSIAINAFRDNLRSRSNQQNQLEHEFIADLPSNIDGPEQQIMASELNEAIAQHVSSLPPRQREVLVLTTYEGMSIKEIGGMLDMKPANVYTTLHHARTTLKEKLKPFLEKPANSETKSETNP